MARQAVTKGQLLKVEGAQEIIDRIGRIIDKTTGKEVKEVYYKASQIVSNQVRANISGLGVSQDLKRVLIASVASNRTEEKNPFAIAIMSQHAAIKKLGASKAAGNRVPNPHWFEYGTASRSSGGGNRGQIRPTPFFRPAVQAKRSEVRDSLISGLEDIIERAAKSK